MTTRREVLGWTAAGLGMLASGVTRAAVEAASKPLDILFLGGTGFIGPYQVEHALARGHKVTLFNRGRSAATPFDGKVELLIGNRDPKVDQGLSAIAAIASGTSSSITPDMCPAMCAIGKPAQGTGWALHLCLDGRGLRTGVKNTVESSPLRALPDPKNEQMSWDARAAQGRVRSDRAERARKVGHDPAPDLHRRSE